MSGPIHLPASLLQSVMDTLMDCGSGRNECIVYATARLESPRVADAFIHPHHASTPVSTTVESAELNHVWDELRETGRKIVMQIHSHPAAAFHSSTDDNFPIIHSVGFLSLVLPSFGGRGLEGAHLAVYEGGASWHAPSEEKKPEFLVIDHAS